MGSCPGAKKLFLGSVELLAYLLGFCLGKRGAEDLGLVVFKALDFGLHVFSAGLFGGEGGFVWFRFWLGDDGFDWRGCFGLSGGRFGWSVGFVRREALGL